jgi:hypothetical protein
VDLTDRPKMAIGQRPRATTIRHLVETVGPPILQVLDAPHGLDHRVRGTYLHDPMDPLPDGPDAVLLLAGLRTDEPAAVAVTREAADRGYCAIVVKRRGRESERLTSAASRSGLAVLSAADEVPWRHLDGLLLSVLGSQGSGGESVPGGGDELFALVNAIAAVIGGSVAIEDLDRRVLAYSSLPNQRIDALREQGILDRRVPLLDRHLAQYGTVLAATGVVRFSAEEVGTPRAAITIRAGTQPLGTIWAIEGVNGLDPEGEQALIDGARLSALHIIRSRNANELNLQVRENVLHNVLEGQLTGREVAFRLALPPGTELALIGFAALSRPAEDSPLIAHVGHSLARHFAAFRSDAGVTTTARAVYVLVPGGGPEAARRLATRALGALSATFSDYVRAAIARTSSDPMDLPVMRREVDDILRVTTAQPELPRVADLRAVQTRVLLAHVADELAREPRLRHPGVDAMVAHDREHRTEYTISVTAWLDAVGDVAVAAQRLGVHPNTLRYRMRRSAELFNVSMDEPDDRLAAWLQLRLAAGPTIPPR